MAGATQAEGVAAGALRERKLAAVVFTDVVGYSAMVQADEADGLRRVAADLASMRDTCARHGGEFLNAMGDGLMLGFGSAVAAVEFATAAQRAFAARNESAPKGGQLQHRIGIHVGDVFTTAEGVLAGDGVNIAARLESQAPHGGVCVSQAVRDLVRGKVDFNARFGGMRALKNIADPMAVWLWHPHDAIGTAARAMPVPAAGRRRRTFLIAGATGSAAIAAGIVAWLAKDSAQVGPRSLAVLPFANLSEDKDAAYFADGVHEDLLTQLALLRELKVVSRTSVMEYRNTTKKVAQIGSELKVGALVEGSVRRAGNSVRVTAQLIDTKADRHIWAANYDRDLKDVFRVQNDLAREIAGSLNVSLTAAEEQRMSRAPTQNLQAYEYYLRHQQSVRDAAGTVRFVAGGQERLALLQKAVDLDPTFALAWGRIAAERARARGYGVSDDRERDAALAREAIGRAKALRPDDPQIKIDEAAMLVHGMDDQQGAVRLYEDVLRSAPYHVEALVGLSEVLRDTLRVPESAQLLERALAVDARHTVSMTRLAITYGDYRHFDRSLQLRQQLIDLRPDEIDRQAGYHLWNFWKTGRWDAYDRWRPGLPAGIENRISRVRNLDADRAISRRDFALVHRLIDVDAADWTWAAGGAPQEAFAGLDMLHALAWRAQGERARALQSARQGLSKFLSAAARNKAFDSWGGVATGHALLGDRAAALEAHARDIALPRSRNNLWHAEMNRRERVNLDALLGDEEAALSALGRLVHRPNFFIHDAPVKLELARLWEHPRLLALVADPASNAPLPLDTPFAEPAR